LAFPFLVALNVEMLISVIRLQKSFNFQRIQHRERMSMSATDESLQTILDDILREHSNNGMKLMDSALNEEIRVLIKSKLANVLLEKLKSRILDKLETSKEIEREFEAAVLVTWRKPFDLLDLLLNVCFEVANEFTSEYGSGASSKRGYVQAALARQQANACLVFNEILHLLKSGFPSGAHSHWKTLHELACVSYFISKHGEEIAERFLDYEVVEAYFRAEAIREHQQKMECTLLSESDFKAVKKEFKAMEKKYGSDFVKKVYYPYGWVPRTVLKTRSLKEIEKSVGLDTFRPYYDLAGYSMHGGQSGLVFKLGAGKNKNKRAVIPIGPSNYGLADPGKSAAISLGQITACLLMADSGIKRLVIVEALRNLVDEICDAFGEIEAEFGKN
jgi:hypothetical protein